MIKKGDRYWGFWRVVFAGWLIRYPGKVIRPLGILLGILIVIIYKAVTN
jgi:lauroyl/myristoyl acyltransferase